jgi:lipopolysaccharide biosynthesis glycosyltransferase
MEEKHYDDKRERIHVLYASDDHYAEPLGVSIESMLSNCELKVHIYIISQSISKENIERIYKICEHYGQNMTIIDAPDINKLIDRTVDIRRYSLSMFSRFFVATLIPRDVLRIIYLDCDTLINGDISLLWRYDLNGKAIGAANDLRSAFYGKNLGMDSNKTYVNSGVLLIDLQRYRELNYETKLLSALEKYNFLLEFPDNDIICKVLADEITMLPMRFNAISLLFGCVYKELRLMRHPSHMICEEEYDSAVLKPLIVHFTACVLIKYRPWIIGCDHPEAAEWLKYRKQTPWEKEPLKRCGKSRAWVALMCFRKICPRKLLVSLMGVLHAYIKPFYQYFSLKRYKKIFTEQRREVTDMNLVKLLVKLKNNTLLRTALYPYKSIADARLMKGYKTSSDSKKVSSLKDRFSSQRCFIIGNGPSLTLSDVEKLNGQYTFAANAIHSVFSKTSWRPFFYTCIDSAALRMFGSALLDYDIPYVFFDVGGKKHIKKGKRDAENLYFICQHRKYKIYKWGFEQPFISARPDAILSSGTTVTFTAIQLAIYMGFKKIYLLGVDNNYSRKIDSKGVVYEDRGVKSYSDVIFDPGLGVQYVDIATAAYKAAREYADAHDIEILNATRGGALEEFKRVDFDDIITRKEESNE